VQGQQQCGSVIEIATKDLNCSAGALLACACWIFAKPGHHSSRPQGSPGVTSPGQAWLGTAMQGPKMTANCRYLANDFVACIFDGMLP
jgi:hypothetical protein